MKAILIMGSTADEPHAKKITDKLDEYGIGWEQHAASAHKQPLKVLEILENNKDGKDIVVSQENICGILTSVINNYYALDDQPGLNTLFQIPTRNGNLSKKDKCIIRTINIIVNYIRTETERINCNKTLSIWNSVYGDFNEKGLRAHPPLKILENSPNKPEFHMRY